MNESQRELLEGQLLSIAKRLEYPRTPDVARFVRRRLGSSARPRLGVRWLAGALILLLVLGSSLMLIPSARAAILEFIQIGAVRIFRAKPPKQEFPVTATRGPTSKPLIPMLEQLAGETTLAEAQRTLDYPILLPSYPRDLGQPDRVFVQE